jgi:hypothetical protein
MLFGHAMAEDRETLINARDRLERFSIRDETSDNLKVLGYRVVLSPTYLSIIEAIKIQNLLNTLEAQLAYENHLN